MKRPTLPEPAFYPLADLAMLWGCTVDRLRVFAGQGALDGRKLQIIEVAGIAGVAPEEARRFRKVKPAPADAVGTAERKSMLSLIGILTAGWSGGDVEMLAHHYTLFENISKWAARSGVPILRTDDTYAALIKEAIADLAARGYEPAKAAQSETGADEVPPEQEAA